MPYTYQVQVGSETVWKLDPAGNVVYEPRYETQMQQQTRWIQVPELVVPEDPSHFILSPHSGEPIYGSPVVVGEDESYNPIYGRGYAKVNGVVVAVPYQDLRIEWVPSQIWVDGTAPTLTLISTTPPYTPGYATPALPPLFSSIVNTAPGSSADSETGTAGAPANQVTWINGEGDYSRPVVNQNSDRWGNVLNISDSRSANWVTHYRYNANNQLITLIQTDADGNSGVDSQGNIVNGNAPVTRIYYDQMGRQVAHRRLRGHGPARA